MKKLKTDKESWATATLNLIHRRSEKTQIRATDSVLSDYCGHLTRCGYGKSILDIGCGAQSLKQCVPESVKYIGIDPFPIEGLDIIPVSIEDINTQLIQIDTTVAFAVMDSIYDFEKAILNIKIITNQNAVFLTGIDIEPDKYHTFKLSLSDYDDLFSDWRCSVRIELKPKVWLLNYLR